MTAEETVARPRKKYATLSASIASAVMHNLI